MTSILTRWGIPEFATLERTINRMMQDAFAGNGIGEATAPVADLPVNVRETANDYEVQALVPGFSMSEVELTVQDDQLTITGKKETRNESKKGAEGEAVWHRREFAQVEFRRVLRLPTGVDAQHVDAQLKDGVLTIHLPKAEAVKPRKITVKAT
jgi:HSP20 family protein